MRTCSESAGVLMSSQARESSFSTATIDELEDRRFFQLSDFDEGFRDRVRALDRWRLLAERFDAFERQPGHPSSGRIPKRIHQIWLGGGLPQEYAAWTQSWRAFHAGWEYRLWDERAILELGLANEHAFRKSRSLGAKSDIARYEILERMGGIYVDTDFECLRPMDELAERCSFVAAIVFSDSPVIANGLVGCAPGHRLMKRLVRDLRRPITTKDGMKVLGESGPYYFTERFFDDVTNMDVGDVILPSTFFYPFPNFRQLQGLSQEDKRKHARQWSFAIHYWETSWLAPDPLRSFLAKAKKRLLAGRRKHG
jgi:hypothetical protein